MRRSTSNRGNREQRLCRKVLNSELVAVYWLQALEVQEQWLFLQIRDPLLGCLLVGCLDFYFLCFHGLHNMKAKS